MSRHGFARLWYVSLAVLLPVVVLCFGSSALAQGPGPTKFTIESQSSVLLGDTVTLPVLYDNDSSGLELGAVHLVVRYDTLALTLLDVAEGPLISDRKSVV